MNKFLKTGLTLVMLLIVTIIQVCMSFYNIMLKYYCSMDLTTSFSTYVWKQCWAPCLGRIGGFDVLIEQPV